MGIKKNFFALSASGLGATRRAAMLLLVMMLTTATAWATDKTLSGSESYTAQDGDVLTGSTSGTVTIADNASITLSDVTITGGIVCAGTAEITLVGTNSVSGATNKAGIQVGGSDTKLTIKGNGSLTANGGNQSAGIGLSRAWNPANDVIGGNIVIEGGNITANGSVNGQWGAGIGTGVIKGGTATLGTITIKGGSVKATGGSEADGIGTGYTYNGCTNAIGTVTIYDGIDMVDASSIKNSGSIVYKHEENDVTANKTDYFTIIEDGSRRVIFPKDDTDYTITIADGIEHGTIACEATTAKLGANVTITATPDQGYIFSRLVVKDAQNNDVESTGNSFIMPKSNVSVSAIFAEGSYNGTCGNGVYYAYDSSTKTLTISGSGVMTDYNDVSERPWNSYASDIQKVVIGAGVTSIGVCAFMNCPNLATVTVYAPSCTLGDNAFLFCNNLANIYVFNDLVDDYQAAWSTYATKITGITGGYCGTTDHERDVVWVLTGKSPNYTLTISGEGAMYDCYNPSEYPWYSYANQIYEVVIGNGVTSIGKYAFDGTALTSIEIPASVTSIGVDAFSSCDYLESVTFAEGSQLTSIGDGAFASSDLTSITIPASVTSIGEDVFLNCDNLASMAVADGNTVYDSRNGCNAIIEKSTNTLIIGCKNSTIPAGVTSIGAWAFYATGLTSIEIPASVTSIGGSAFGATGLTSVEIPASVTSIGRCAFLNCLNLATVTVYAPSCSLGEDAFADCGSLANIYVFSDLVDNYKAAENWSDYKGKITEMPNPNGKCGDNVRWALTGESTNYTLTICGDGNMDYNDLPERPWEEYAEEIRTVVIESGVESISNNAFQGCSNLATVSFAPCSTLKTIGDGAFQNCHNLTSITIPASVTSIGSDVFLNCNNLASITVEAGNTVYDSRNGCNAIIVKSTNTLIIGCNNSTIPAGVTSIGESAFYATDLTSIEIPAGVTSIGAWAFCVTGLTSIEIPASVTSIGERAFQNCPNLATVTVYAPSCTLGDKAFLNCSNLENIYVFSDKVASYQAAWSAYASKIKTLPNPHGYCGTTGHENDVIWVLTGESSNYTLTISGTGKMAAYDDPEERPWKEYCSSITNVVIENGVTTIGDDAFDGCANLTSVTIPASVTSIGNYAFYDTYLTSIEIPANVTSIGEGAFGRCSYLETMTVDAGNTVYDSRNNCNAIIKKSDNTLIAGCKETEIPDGVTTIGILAFYNCQGLTSVTIPASVTSIGEGAFEGSGLESITISANVTSIDDYAFYNCSKLESITIPASVTSIGVGAFGGCSNLETMTVDGENTVYESSNDCIIETSTHTLIAGCKNTTIPASVTSIGVSAFEGCENLTSVTIPANVTSIGDDAFMYCESLTSVTVYAPSCSLGTSVFEGCDNLTDIYVFGKDVVFYKGATNWRAYADKISVIFDGTSTETINIPNEVTVKGVMYNRTFTPSKASTVMLPFDYTCNGQEGGTFYKFVGVEKENDNWVATMKATGDDANNQGTLTRNTPYLFMPTATTMTFPNIPDGGVTLCTTGGGNRVTADEGSHWTFKGTYKYMKWTTDIDDPKYNADREAEIGRAYGFAGVEKAGISMGDFVKVKSGAKIRPMYCYLLWSDTPNAANARSMTRGAAATDEELPQRITVRLVGSNGEVTGIGTLDTKTGEMTFDSEAWYTPDGVRLSGKPTKKGLYINNGRKVVIK